MASLTKLIARARAAVDTETDPRKLAGAQAALAAFLVTKAEMDEDKGPDSDEDDEDDEDSKSAKAKAAAEKAKRSAEAAKHRAKAAEHKSKAAESEEAAKKCEAEGDDEEEEEAAAAVIPTAHDALLASLAQSVADLKRTQTEGTKAALIAGARRLGAITKTEGAWLGDQPLASVETFLQMRSKAGLVTVDEESLLKPKHAQPGTEESLPAEAREMIESSVAAYPGDKKVFRETLVKAHLEAHTKQLAAASNGVGRY
jgi:hypothetical protein